MSGAGNDSFPGGLEGTSYMEPSVNSPFGPLHDLREKAGRLLLRPFWVSLLVTQQSLL